MSGAARFFWIDAFADAPLSGNPAAVCLLEDALSDELSQALAAEFNLSETVFLTRAADRFGIRWFTPTREVPLVGHATLAAAHAVMAHVEPHRSAIEFASRESGIIRAWREEGGYAIDLPADLGVPCEAPPAMLAGLGAQPQAVSRGRHYMAIFESEDEIAGLVPDFDALAGLDRPTVVVTAPGANVDYVLRFFAPSNGVPEDPVSGVAQCSLVPYWADRLGRTRLLSQQLSSRGGTMKCRLAESGQVTVAGACRTIVHGRLDDRAIGLSA